MADPAEPPPAASETVSTTHPDAAWAVKWGRAALAYYNNYLIDTPRQVIHHLRDGGGVRGRGPDDGFGSWSSAFVGLRRTLITGGMSHPVAILVFLA
jgi:hypothetical protein